jgi:hypothetical protein
MITKKVKNYQLKFALQLPPPFVSIIASKIFLAEELEFLSGALTRRRHNLPRSCWSRPRKFRAASQNKWR